METKGNWHKSTNEESSNECGEKTVEPLIETHPGMKQHYALMEGNTLVRVQRKFRER